MASGSKETQSQGNVDAMLAVVSLALGLGFLYKIVIPWAKDLLNHHRLSISLYLITISLVVGFFAFARRRNAMFERERTEIVTRNSPGAVFLGHDAKSDEPVFLKESVRTSHMQVIGTTNAGKTTSVILPCAVSDIESGRGFLIIDGKSDMNFLKTLYAHAKKNEREKDFLIFSLSKPEISSTFNPFYGGSPEQITERIFSSFEFSDEYYKNIQFLGLRTMTAFLMSQKKVATPMEVRELLRNRDFVNESMKGTEGEINYEVAALLQDPKEKYLEKYSGLVTSLGHFSQGATAPLFNTATPEIILSECLKKKKLVYFQLPTMQYPFLGQATGKLVLQNLQSAISELQTDGEKLDRLFSVYLDDFNDYIYPGFASLLNKSRSANVGVVFSHQSLGDLEKVSPDFKNVVLTNTNVKVVMRSNDPESAEFFARMIGTKTGEAFTSRRTTTFSGEEDTGEKSVREVEEFLYHPNVFKSGLGLGEGLTIIPYEEGNVVKHVKFSPPKELTLEGEIPRKFHSVFKLPTPVVAKPDSTTGKEPDATTKPDTNDNTNIIEVNYLSLK